MALYFYDTYAFIEYFKNNPLYVFYFEQNDGILTLFNILEIYYAILNDAGESEANLIMDKLYPYYVVQPTKEEIKKAMDFKSKNKQFNLSYADCLGYCIANQRGIKFLTGDMQFKNRVNVEFVK